MFSFFSSFSIHYLFNVLEYYLKKMENMENLNNSSKNSCNSIKCIMELIFLLVGLLSNSIFILVIYKNRTTKKFVSPKPFRHLLIAILIR